VQAKNAAEASFLLNRVFARLERVLHRLPPSCARNRYALAGHNYSDRELALKEAAVQKALPAAKYRTVLDIGCNTGRYSFFAAQNGARVVAIDRDGTAVGELWRAAATQNADILPLVVDIARPPGASGWANQEHPSFLEWARNHFDCVLMLALVHHLIVNERAPLDAIFEMLAQLTRRTAIIEYVDSADMQFQRIVRGRGQLHRDLTTAAFETAAQRYFRIEGQCDVTPTRRIYVLERPVR
jgi:SAM-dependent methyltransferase